jgi:hypothetical protein
MSATWEDIIAQIPAGDGSWNDDHAIVRKEITRMIGKGYSDALVTKYANDAVAGYQERERRTLERAYDLADKAGVTRAEVDEKIGSQGMSPTMAWLMALPTTPPAASPAPVPPAALAPANGNSRPAKKERKRNSPGFVRPRRAGSYIDPARGYFSMYNALTDTNLLAALPAPLLRAYVYAHRLANDDGSFAVSHATVATKIGAKDVRHGQRVLQRLQAVGLIRLLTRGSAVTQTSNTYQLVPLADLDLVKVKAALAG